MRQTLLSIAAVAVCNAQFPYLLVGKIENQHVIIHAINNEKLDNYFEGKKCRDPENM